MTWHRGKGGTNWGQNLTKAQRESIKEIRNVRNAGVAHTGSWGWTVYVMPTVGPARYCELRHRLGSNRIARWVIEQDGSISADNGMGALRDVVPVDEQ
jgi:hypothetical protein